MTLLDDIDDGELSSDSWLLRRTVPGYDYRVREDGVETDRQIRDKLARDLKTAKERLADVSDRLYRRDDRAAVETVGRLEADIDRLRQRVSTASSGGGSVRDLAVDEQEALLSLVEYDASLVAEVEELVDLVNDLREAAVDNDPIDPQVQKCEMAITDLDKTFTQRQDYMEGLKE